MPSSMQKRYRNDSADRKDISYRYKKCAYEKFMWYSRGELTYRHLQINVDTCLHPTSLWPSPPPLDFICPKELIRIPIQFNSRLNLLVLNPLQIYYFLIFSSVFSFRFFLGTSALCIIYTEASPSDQKQKKKEIRILINFSAAAPFSQTYLHSKIFCSKDN